MPSREISRAIPNRPGAPFGMFSRAPIRAAKHPRLSVFWLALSFAVMTGLVLFFYVWFRLQVIDLGYALAASRTLGQKLQQENRELSIELATLTSPARLEAAAQARLGMRPARSDEVVILP